MFSPLPPAVSLGCGWWRHKKWDIKGLVGKMPVWNGLVAVQYSIVYGEEEEE